MADFLDYAGNVVEVGDIIEDPAWGYDPITAEVSFLYIPLWDIKNTGPIAICRLGNYDGKAAIDSPLKECRLVRRKDGSHPEAKPCIDGRCSSRFHCCPKCKERYEEFPYDSVAPSCS